MDDILTVIDDEAEADQSIGGLPAGYKGESGWFAVAAHGGYRGVLKIDSEVRPSRP